MVRPERLLMARQRPLVERLCRLVAALGDVQPGEVVEVRSDCGIIRPERLLIDRQCAPVERFRRREAALAKVWGTEAAWRCVDECLQIRGGRGYETASSRRQRGESAEPVERMMRDSRINTIFEGSSEIMRLFIAREALDPHLKKAAGALNSRLPMGERLKTAARAGLFYAGWYPRQWLPIGPGGLTGMDSKLARHVAWAARNSRRLARRLFHSMARYGPKLEREQILLGRYVDIGTDLFAMAATCSRAQSLLEQGTPREQVLPLADFFCRETRLRIRGRFRGVRQNNDRRGYRLARQVLADDLLWLESGIVGHWD